MANIPQEKPEIGRREKKKASIRADIVKAAHSLFEARGFDEVTVAEVAKAADISVKTLFQYFRAKEDIVFENEMDLAKQIAQSISDRRKGTPIFKAAASTILKLIEEEKNDSLAQLEGFSRMMDNPVLHSRLQMMWLRYEDLLTKSFADELTAGVDDPRPRLVSMQIVALLRLLTGEESRRHLAGQQQQKKAFLKWVQKASQFAASGLSEFGLRS